MGCRKNLATKRWPLTSWTLWCLMAPLRLVIAPPRLDTPQSSSIGSPCRSTEERTVLLTQLLPRRFLKFTGNVESRKLITPVMAYKRHWPVIFSNRMRKNTKHLNKDSWFPDRDSNYELPNTKHSLAPASYYIQTYHRQSNDVSDLKVKWH